MLKENNIKVDNFRFVLGRLIVRYLNSTLNEVDINYGLFSYIFGKFAIWDRFEVITE